MRVFLVASFIHGGYGIVIRRALEDLGCKVFSFAPNILPRMFGRDFMNQRLGDYLEAWPHDVLLVFKSGYVSPEAFGRDDARRILWWPDAPWRYSDFHQLTPYFDEVYTTGKCDECDFLPMGVYPKLFHEVRLTGEDKWKYGCDVVFIGTGHPSRQVLFLNIFKRLSPKYSIKVWGNDWGSFPWWSGEDLYYLDYSKALSGGKIVINCRIDKEFSPIFRSVEATGMKRLYLSQSGEGLNECFEEGEEYVSYDTVYDAVEKITYYLENEDERKEIARRGLKRCLKNHLLKDKLANLLDIPA